MFIMIFILGMCFAILLYNILLYHNDLSIEIKPISISLILSCLPHSFIWLLCYQQFNEIPISILYSLFFSVLIHNTWIDHRCAEILDRTHFIIILLAGLSLTLNNIDLSQRIVGLLFIPICLLLMNKILNHYLLDEGIGLGDIKFIAVCGLFIGFQHIVLTLFISNLLACIYVFILFIRKRKVCEVSLPFIPFISIGLFFSILYAKEIINILYLFV